MKSVVAVTKGVDNDVVEASCYLCGQPAGEMADMAAEGGLM